MKKSAVLPEKRAAGKSCKAAYKVDLVGLQTACEVNYVRLFKLAGTVLCAGIGQTEKFATEWHGQYSKTELEVIEQTRYTTVISLTQITCSHDWLTLPRFVVRLYHDVRMAEVITANGYRQLQASYEYPNPNMHQPDEKQQLNQILGEWLDHCLATGKVTI